MIRPNGGWFHDWLILEKALAYRVTTWRITSVSKWLITMVPKWGCGTPSKWPFTPWRPLMEVILTTYKSWDDAPRTTLWIQKKAQTAIQLSLALGYQAVPPSHEGFFPYEVGPYDRFK